MFQKLGNFYYFNGELDKAAKWYDELFAMAPDQQTRIFLPICPIPESRGQTDKANEILEKFHQKAGNDKRANLYEKNKNYLDRIKVIQADTK